MTMDNGNGNDNGNEVLAKVRSKGKVSKTKKSKLRTKDGKNRSKNRSKKLSQNPPQSPSRSPSASPKKIGSRRERRQRSSKQTENSRQHSKEILNQSKEEVLSPIERKEEAHASSPRYRKKRTFFEQSFKGLESFHLRLVTDKITEKSSKISAVCCFYFYFYYLYNVLSKNTLFKTFGTKMIKKAVTLMYCVEMRKGDRLISKGHPNQAFFVIEKGRLRGHLDSIDPLTGGSSSSLLARSTHRRKSEHYHRKNTFGENTLLYGEQPTTTIEAMEYCRLWALDGNVFMQLKKTPGEKSRTLQAVPFFSSIVNSKRITIVGMSKENNDKCTLTYIHTIEDCTPDQLSKMCDNLRTITYRYNDKITTEGENVVFFQIIVSGSAIGWKYDPKKCKEVKVQAYEATKASPAYFGDKEIQNGSPHELTIKVASKTLKTFALRSSYFKQLMMEFNSIDENPLPSSHVAEGSVSVSGSGIPVGGEEEISMAANDEDDDEGGGEEGAGDENGEEERDEPSMLKLSGSKSKKPNDDKENPKFVNRINTPLSKLRTIGILGAGAFGTVSLVEDLATQTTYSLKKIRKNKVVDTGQERHVQNERRILATVDSDFCVRLFATYQDKLNVYLLLEAVLGGELFYLLRFNKKFEEPVARFYAGCVVCAFEHIHSKKLIFRDLKPENLLLASNGYCKLIDFGFAKYQDELRTFFFFNLFLCIRVVLFVAICRYLIQRNFVVEATVDWWALGVFIYEMLFGIPPFRQDAQVKMYEKILTSPVEFPERPVVSAHAQDIIASLLKKQPHKRLGSGEHGAKDVKKHPWFQNINWTKMKTQEPRAPYIPRIENKYDLRNFEYLQIEDLEEELLDDPTGEIYHWCEGF
ncbi:hypothetical protein RFI_31100 [Reticulomyxa filosa]|uniref:Uncharacterized protein n=1 Tax=Reticulomyxa filosa TaxID=46433 RepID=X6LY62_RETFI|nr:hypothetical protein RFI_31100 [Reticulomyxa filosa]|eukprot:ETO06296.1 hypothetical protein RFI_31100 [Reticulomyxa filosa]